MNLLVCQLFAGLKWPQYSFSCLEFLFNELILSAFKMIKCFLWNVELWHYNTMCNNSVL